MINTLEYILGIDLSEIILTWGSFLSPKIRDFIFNNFEGNHLNYQIKTEETITYGAIYLSYEKSNLFEYDNFEIIDTFINSRFIKF